MIPSRAVKPTATAMIEPVGRRTRDPRDHSIKVVLEFGAVEARYSDRGYVNGVARRSLEGFPPANGEPDQRAFSEVSASGKAGAPSNAAVGVEGSAIWRGRPGDALVEGLRAGLFAEGYRVVVRERRECVKSACTTDAVVDWNQPSLVPRGWHSNLVCGRHNYRECSRCRSIYIMTSVNFAGQAPSVHCEVCGAILVEWGGSKMWNAELETRGTATA